MQKDAIFVRPLADSPKCQDCHETVLVLDRFLLTTDDSINAIRHRRCFRCERCKNLLRIGLYRPTKSGIGYECLEHEKEDLVNRSTPAPGHKPKEPEKKEELPPTEETKIYPELPKVNQPPLYPRLASPEEKALDLSADSGVASSSPDLTTPKSTIGKASNQLSPPVPSRSRSSDRGKGNDCYFEGMGPFWSSSL